jgi:RimJ/RimL family protein N-acetyltransferase
LRNDAARTFRRGAVLQLGRNGRYNQGVDSLTTDRLELVPITRALVEAVLAEDRPTAERLVAAKFPRTWPGKALVERAFACPLEKLREDPDSWLWGARVLVTRDKREVVGSVVLNGRPDETGSVEVGYGVDAEVQGYGFATEGTRAVVRWTLAQRDVARVVACTFPWHKASLRVLEKVGMTPAGVRETDMFGDLVVYHRLRS